MLAVSCHPCAIHHHNFWSSCRLGWLGALLQLPGKFPKWWAIGFLDLSSHPIPNRTYPPPPKKINLSRICALLSFRTVTESNPPPNTWVLPAKLDGCTSVMNRGTLSGCEGGPMQEKIPHSSGCFYMSNNWYVHAGQDFQLCNETIAPFQDNSF